MNSKENSMAFNLGIHFFTTNYYIMWARHTSIVSYSVVKSCNYGHYLQHIPFHDDN